MHFTDLPYRREVHGITRRQFARLLGRSYHTVAQWESGTMPLPAWLQDWMEYMDMELICGRTPEHAPRLLEDIEAILYPTLVAARRASKRPRRTKAAHTLHQHAMAAKRAEKRAKRAETKVERAARKAHHEARWALLDRAAMSRADRARRRAGLQPLEDPFTTS